VGEAFVDDTGLGTNKAITRDLPPPKDSVNIHSNLISNLGLLTQEWEKLLFSTGGALNLDKCFWFLLSWKCIHGRAKFYTADTAPGVLEMMLEDCPKLSIIKRLEPTESFRTLGIFISPSGSNKGALTVLTVVVLQYSVHITVLKPTRQESLTSYIQYLLPKICYQPPLL
jgi:hypothetical protein